mmetsp:Transcript_26375/g.47347  ORF Transcript_26375/g.47347 Transcript_26375/m.47347 type:complete len:110 (-) Transcript_26375:1032-1361(-)
MSDQHEPEALPKRRRGGQTEDQGISKKVCIEDAQESAKRKSDLEAVYNSLSEETKNQVLLQAVKHFSVVKAYRDSLALRVAELDNTFGEWLMSLSDNPNKKPEEGTAAN